MKAKTMQSPLRMDFLNAIMLFPSRLGLRSPCLSDLPDCLRADITRGRRVNKTVLPFCRFIGMLALTVSFATAQLSKVSTGHTRFGCFVRSVHSVNLGILTVPIK